MSVNRPQSTLLTSPPQQPGGSGPYGPPPTSPGKKWWPARHKVITTLLAMTAVIFIIVIANAGGGGGTGKAPTANQPSTATNSPSHQSSGAAASPSASPSSGVAGIGTPVRDGKFEFVITGVTHAKSVGGEFGQTAQGEYTILHISVKNIGNESQLLADSAQHVYDSSGRKYDADSAAGLYLNGNGNANVFLQEINPGNTVQGQIAFDMSKGVQAVKAELHDSMFSGGVTVNLR